MLRPWPSRLSNLRFPYSLARLLEFGPFLALYSLGKHPIIFCHACTYNLGLLLVLIGSAYP